jgi:nucleoside-diphosphate-sugar epimerase
MNAVEALLARGEEVVLFDRGRLPRAAEHALTPHHKHLACVYGDVLNAAVLSAVFDGRRINRILHCAAVTSGSERDARDPGSVVEVNLQGMINVLGAAREHGVSRVVCASSGAVYGESLQRSARMYEDSTPAVPVTLYAITKFAAERIALRLRDLWNLDVVCARLGTLVGPWERDTGVRDNFGTHSQLARLALAGRTAILPPREVRRDWVYSRDIAEGLVALLDAEAPRHFVYNLSSGADWSGSVLIWCGMLKAACPRFNFRVAGDGEAPNVTYTDTDRNPMDIGRMAQDIGFTPRFSPLDALADYLEWLRRTADFWDRA